MDIFSKYQPFFGREICNDQIGVCKWMEGGTTIDTAVPELETLIDGKEAWRALIVRYIDEPAMSFCPSNASNPYDFQFNANATNRVHESSIPLIRLTQMLGGVPAADMEFRCEILKNASYAIRNVYEPVIDADQERLRGELEEKYRFNGKKPEQIMLLSVRSKECRKEDLSLGKTWERHSETYSSQFWRRNRYPSNCRFMLYDMVSEGVTQRNADEFGFWYTVLLLSLNDWTSAVASAYRVYRLRPVFNHDAMTGAFQEKTEHLMCLRRTIEDSIYNLKNDRAGEETKLPLYSVDVPVVVNTPSVEEKYVQTNAFGPMSRGASADISIWETSRTRVEKQYKDCVRKVDRALDKAAEQVRDSNSMRPDYVQALNGYQREDLEEEVDGIFHRIIDAQAQLPCENADSDEALQNASKAVKKELQGRVTVAGAITVFGIAVVLLLLGMLTPIIGWMKEGNTFPVRLADIALYGSAIVATFALCCLILHKMRLNGYIRDYNRHMLSVFNRLIGRAGEYSSYLTDMTNYARGNSYLRLSQHRTHRTASQNEAGYIHLKAIRSLLERIELWSRAFDISTDDIPMTMNQKVIIDVRESPAVSEIYQFEADEHCQTEINCSGIMMQVPYDFADRLEIEREELYDNES